MNFDSSIPHLDDRVDVFPSIEEAQNKRDGLLAMGGDLSVDRLLAAYKMGIFPWYDVATPILWLAKRERMVLFVDDLRIHRSLSKTLRNKKYRVTLNQCFSDVMEACAHVKRAGQEGTWILLEMRRAYGELHARGKACSFECWMLNAQGQWMLSGGLYGVILGRVFFGESMFSLSTDASKIAFAHAVPFLKDQGVPLVDCQMYTSYLASFGAQEIPFSIFQSYLDRFTNDELQLNFPAITIIEN